MDEMKLPHYIADRWERRWTGRFAQKLKDLQGGLRIPRVSGDPIRSLEVRCLPERLYGEQSRAHSGLARPDLPAITAECDFCKVGSHWNFKRFCLFFQITDGSMLWLRSKHRCWPVRLHLPAAPLHSLRGPIAPVAPVAYTADHSRRVLRFQILGSTPRRVRLPVWETAAIPG